MPQGSDSLYFAHVTSIGSVRRLVGAKRVAPIPEELFPGAAAFVGSRWHVEHGAAVDALVDGDEASTRAEGDEVVLAVQQKVFGLKRYQWHYCALLRGNSTWRRARRRVDAILN